MFFETLVPLTIDRSLSVVKDLVGQVIFPSRDWVPLLIEAAERQSTATTPELSPLPPTPPPHTHTPHHHHPLSPRISVATITDVRVKYFEPNSLRLFRDILVDSIFDILKEIKVFKELLTKS